MNKIYFLILILCVSALAIAYFFMQQWLDLPPCPLCILDRIVLAAIAVCALIALLHKSARSAHRVYSGLISVFAGLGIVLAARHIYLQNLPTEEIPNCIPDLDYMLDTFSWLETFTMIFNTSGECADIQWSFLGFTIPEQTLLLFIILAGLGLVQIITTIRK